MNWEAQYLPPGMATKPWHSGWRLHKCSGKLGRTFSQSLHIPKSVRAMYDSPLQNTISPALPMLLPNCSSLSPTTRDEELGQRAAHLYPEGPQNLPLSSLKVFAFPSPSRIFIDPKGHTRAQLKLEVSGIPGEKNPTLVPGAFPRPRCPTSLACLLPGEGFSYFPSRETCRFPHYHMNGAQAPLST